MSKWLKNINAGSIPLKGVDDFTTNINIVKSAESGVSNIDNAIKNLNYTQVGDEIHVNDVRFRDLEPKFRKGDITGALNDANVANTITSAEEATLKQSINAEAPDLDIQNMETKITEARKYHEDLNVKAENGTDLESKLSPKSQEKAKSMYSKIVKVVGVGGVAAGIFAAMLISGKVFDDLAEATNSRNGCFLAYKSPNTLACKLTNRSCGYGTNGAAPCDTTSVQNTIYNIHLMVLDIINTSSTTDINALVALGCTWDTDDTALDVLNVPENIPILSAYYFTKYPTNDSVTFTPCDLGNIIEGCIACNSSLSTNDIQFSTSELLDGNMIYQCIQDSTVIDTLTDIATELGVDLFTASGDSISGSFQGNFFLTVIIILVIIVAAALAIKFIPAPKTKTENHAVGEVASEPPPPVSVANDNTQPLN